MNRFKEISNTEQRRGDLIVGELSAYALLASNGFVSLDEFDLRLDRAFIDMPYVLLLADAEFCMDARQAFEVLMRGVYSELARESFGRTLMSGLKSVYIVSTDLRAFADKAYRLWAELPDRIGNEEPFFALCFADDPLSFGDEKLARSIFEKVLDYYIK